MALYWHYRSKDELLDGMAASVFEDLDPTLDDDATWQDQLRRLLGSLLDAFRAHPSTAALVPTRTIWTDEGLRTTEAALHILGGLGSRRRRRPRSPATR